MTSIKQIPLEDLIKIIKLSNNEYVPKTDDEVYELGWDLIKSGKIDKAPESIINWIIAYNLLKKYPNITQTKALELILSKKYGNDNIIRIFTYLFDDTKYPKIDIEHKNLNFKDRFSNLELIGSGTFGAVYKAFDKQKNITVAIKKLSLDDKRSNTEISILKSLQNVCSQYVLCYIDYMQDNESEYIITEFLGDNWITLSSYIEKKLYIPTEKDIHIIIENLKKGLLLIHKMRIVHRDINPDNIMIDFKTLNIKYIDFGISLYQIIGKNKPTGDIILNIYIKEDLLSLGTVALNLISSFQKDFSYAKTFMIPTEMLEYFKNDHNIRDLLIEAQKLYILILLKEI